MMTAYQLTHQHTANLHYCGPDSAGRPIIVDVAEITAGHFEIAAVWGNGDEIESNEVEDIDTARRLYSELLHKLTAPKPQQAAAKPPCSPGGKKHSWSRPRRRPGQAALHGACSARSGLCSAPTRTVKRTPGAATPKQ